jgi:hypothetical protein
MLRTLVLAAALAACGGIAPTPEPTLRAATSLYERIEDLKQRYGGSRSQYRANYDIDACERLRQIGISQLEKIERNDDDGPESDQSRRATGYLTAASERMVQIDCRDSIPVP